MKGSVAKTGTCGGCAQVGHDDVECPLLFAQAFPNSPMPGWDEDGSRIDANWSGSGIEKGGPALHAQIEAPGKSLKEEPEKEEAWCCGGAVALDCMLSPDKRLWQNPWNGIFTVGGGGLRMGEEKRGEEGTMEDDGRSCFRFFRSLVDGSRGVGSL
eukprot:3802633-Rhodomonas_salina.1